MDREKWEERSQMSHRDPRSKSFTHAQLVYIAGVHNKGMMHRVTPRKAILLAAGAVVFFAIVWSLL